ncbi:MAG: DUF4185 domain-containing protein [Bacteroidetes bacterium]|nr:DUF4185 domain-containing protein [Bacteroidota bacterium]
MRLNILALICVLLTACGVKPTSISNQKELKYTVEAAPEWTNLFYRNSGWFGADGVFSIPLTGVDKVGNIGNRETLLLFSDTYIGEVKDGKPLPGNVMVNNTCALVQGNSGSPDSIQFFYKKDKNGAPQTFFVPQNTDGKKQHFWLGDGFVNQERDNTLYIFAYHIEVTGEGVFDFIEPDVSLIAVPASDSRPPFAKQRQIKTPLHVTVKGETGNLGAGILVNTKKAGAPHPDGYVYVYGCIGKDKNLVAARVKPKDFEDFAKWRYWDGKSWIPDIQRLAPITNAASNELSVTPLPDGRYALIFQVLGLSDKVGMRIGDSPVGPFGDIQEIWRTPEADEGLFCYNAKAHPNLSKPGELLISYNTITLDFWNDIQKDAHIYRPRFIKLKWGN